MCISIYRVGKNEEINHVEPTPKQIFASLINLRTNILSSDSGQIRDLDEVHKFITSFSTATIEEKIALTCKAYEEFSSRDDGCVADLRAEVPELIVAIRRQYGPILPGEEARAPTTVAKFFGEIIKEALEPLTDQAYPLRYIQPTNEDAQT